MKRAERVFLVGMMGCGKSTVGRALAKRLGWRFFDTDRWIEKRAGMTVVRIFEKKGEAAFRRLEAAAARHALGLSACVISTGGGLVSVAATRRLLYGGGASVYLQISPGRILRRLSREGIQKRPLLQGPFPKARLESLLAGRRKAYRQASITVSALGRPQAIAARIAKRLYL